MLPTKAPLPSSESISKCIELATGSSAVYLYEQLTKRFKSEKSLGNSAQLLEAIAKFADYAQFKSNSKGNIWAGDSSGIELSDNQKWQTELARIASKNLPAGEITVNVAINEQAQFLRGYTMTGQRTDDAVTAILDELFNAWLAKENIVNKDGVLYEATKTGGIQKQGNQNLRADAEKVKTLLNDEKRGFKAFVENMNSQVKINTKEHEYKAPKREEVSSTERAADETSIKPQ